MSAQNDLLHALALRAAATATTSTVVRAPRRRSTQNGSGGGPTLLRAFARALGTSIAR